MPEGFAAPRGESITELIEAELDKAYYEMQASEDDGKLLAQGECRGLSLALAIIHNPYAPNVKAVKRAAKERYEESK